MNLAIGVPTTKNQFNQPLDQLPQLTNLLNLQETYRQHITLPSSLSRINIAVHSFRGRGQEPLKISLQPVVRLDELHLLGPMEILCLPNDIINCSLGEGVVLSFPSFSSARMLHPRMKSWEITLSPMNFLFYQCRTTIPYLAHNAFTF